MNPNFGDYMAVVHHAHDGCQWNPAENRGALVSDKHFRRTTATWLVGSRGIRKGGIEYRLCDECAKLPRFNHPQHKRRRAAEAA